MDKQASSSSVARDTTVMVFPEEAKMWEKAIRQLFEKKEGKPPRGKKKRLAYEIAMGGFVRQIMAEATVKYQEDLARAQAEEAAALAASSTASGKTEAKDPDVRKADD